MSAAKLPNEMARLINSPIRLSARQYLVLEELRGNQPQMFLNSLSIGCTVAIKLTLSEVAIPPGPHHLWIVSLLSWMIRAIVWLALVASIAVMAINRVSQVRERTRQFAIVRMLGAPFSFIAVLLAEETVPIALLGLVIGIELAAILGMIAAWVMPDVFVFETDFHAWLWAGGLGAMCFFCISVMTAWITTKQHDVLSALSSK